MVLCANVFPDNPREADGVQIVRNSQNRQPIGMKNLGNSFSIDNNFIQKKILPHPLVIL